MRVVSVAEMREIEQRAEDQYGLTSPVLMEHAGRSIAEALREHFGGDVTGREILVLVGPGNNGGDGRVMGRYLADWGAHVTHYVWKGRRLEVDARYIPVSDDLAGVRGALARADAVADALLGTGHTRPLDPTMGTLLSLVREEKQRRSDLFILAVDVPSGLNCDTGAIDDGTIEADMTVTLAFPKTGQFLFPGATYTGTLRVGAIGLPAGMEIAPGLELLDDALIRPLLPRRPLNSNKGTFGKVMILAGSPPYPGSAYLVAAAAARVGAGLVTLATVPALVPLYMTRLPEITYHQLPEMSASPEERAHALLEGLNGYRAVVIGPGLGHDEHARAMLEHVFAGVRTMDESQRPRLIVDADGLNSLAQIDHWWELLPPETIITPHPMEMTRLRGGTAVSGGGADRLEVTARAARDWNLVVVLKGAFTLVASSDGRMRINGKGNPALASAGTGDVLAGAVGGLLAQNVAPFDAAAVAVYLHSEAGSRVSARIGDAGLLAGDLLPELPMAIRAIKQS